MEELIKAENLTFSFGQSDIIKNISFSIFPGEYVSIVGPNGSGKTTLFQILSGYYKPKSGKVFLKGKDIDSISIEDRAKEMTIVHQNQDCNFPFTCFEIVLMGMFPHKARFGRIDKNDFLKIQKIMELTNTLNFANKQITQISGGELQRVIIARALAQNTRLLLLDEAMSDMDINGKIAITKLLKNIAKDRKMAVICINHDLNMAYKFSDRIIALKEGCIVVKGKPQEVFTEDFLKDVFGVRGEIIEDKGFFINDNI